MKPATVAEPVPAPVTATAHETARRRPTPAAPRTSLLNVLVVGGAGHVGSIIRPALESRFTCYYYDLREVRGAEGRSRVGDVNDEDALLSAMSGMQAVVNLTMGVRPGTREDVSDVTAVFDVNVRGGYRVLAAAARAGIRRFVYASSLSVYEHLCGRPRPLTEEVAPNAFHAYGLSKRLGEFMCQAAVERYPDLSVVALRLMQPIDDERWPGNEYKPGRAWHPLGPSDTRRLFTAALEFHRPGFHVVQATGDLGGDVYPCDAAAALLGWRPEGR